MQKKQIAAALLAAACAFPPRALAATGDIAGMYYSTDIVTYVNQVEISSINIGGQTLISAEDMAFYGFNVNWIGSARRLEIEENPLAQNGPPPAVERYNLPTGTPLGYYYETDIVTTLNGRSITAYNIGGRTYIWAEEMREFGYQVVWNAGARTLAVESSGNAPAETPGGGEPGSPGEVLDQRSAEVMRLVNIEREKAGLAPLSAFPALTQAAQIRAPELIALFSHSRPDGTDCFTALEATGADQNIFTAGENIAAGQATPAEVVNGWMNSPGHRANILNPDFTHIGIGYAQGGPYGHYWVQMFVGK